MINQIDKTDKLHLVQTQLFTATAIQPKVFRAPTGSFAPKAKVAQLGKAIPSRVIQANASMNAASLGRIPQEQPFGPQEMSSFVMNSFQKLNGKRMASTNSY